MFIRSAMISALLPCFAIIITCRFATANEWKEISSEVLCGNLKIKVSTLAKPPKEPGDFVEVKDQTATITRNGVGKPFILDYDKGKTKYEHGEREFGILTSYKCLKGKGGKRYLALLFWLGGNCAECEWIDIVGQDRNRIVSSKGGDRASRNFDIICKKLGLPQDWIFNWKKVDWQPK